MGIEQYLLRYLLYISGLGIGVGTEDKTLMMRMRKGLKWLQSTPWSSFYYIFFEGKYYFLDYTAWFVTYDLSLPQISPEQERRLELLLSLSESCLTNPQIAELFNRLEIPTPTGNQYTQKLVWVTLKKYRDRLERIGRFQMTMSMGIRKVKDERTQCVQ